MLGARSGYWNMKLDHQSTDLTTFNTPFGRYRFNRMPMGISCARDEFQRALDTTFGDLPNVLGIADDIVVVEFEDDGQDHDQALHTVLKRARNRGPRFNPDKLIVHAQEITLQSRMRSERTPPCKLTLVRRAVIQVDASGTGLGAALLQGGAPIAFASKSLSDTESRYSNIEREMLGSSIERVYGLERFHHYVFGRHVNVHSDHKPLEAISNKNLANAPPRLARMLLLSQRYNFTIIYRPGKDVPIADALSRISPLKEEEIRGINVEVHQLDTLLHASPARLEDVRQDTTADTTLSVVADIIQRGWPTKRSECPEVALPYWNYRVELGIQNSLLLKGVRIIITKSLQHTFLK